MFHTQDIQLVRFRYGSFFEQFCHVSWSIFNVIVRKEWDIGLKESSSVDQVYQKKKRWYVRLLTPSLQYNRKINERVRHLICCPFNFLRKKDWRRDIRHPLNFPVFVEVIDRSLTGTIVWSTSRLLMFWFFWRVCVNEPMPKTCTVIGCDA